MAICWNLYLSEPNVPFDKQVIPGATGWYFKSIFDFLFNDILDLVGTYLSRCKGICFLIFERLILLTFKVLLLTLVNYYAEL